MLRKFIILPTWFIYHRINKFLVKHDRKHQDLTFTKEEFAQWSSPLQYGYSLFIWVILLVIIGCLIDIALAI